jgi:hypothetical protein
MFVKSLNQLTKMQEKHVLKKRVQQVHLHSVTRGCLSRRTKSLVVFHHCHYLPHARLGVACPVLFLGQELGILSSAQPSTGFRCFDLVGSLCNTISGTQPTNPPIPISRSQRKVHPSSSKFLAHILTSGSSGNRNGRFHPTIPTIPTQGSQAIQLTGRNHHRLLL